MSKLLRQSFTASPVILGASLLLANSALATQSQTQESVQVRPAQGLTASVAPIAKSASLVSGDTTPPSARGAIARVSQVANTSPTSVDSPIASDPLAELTATDTLAQMPAAGGETLDTNTDVLNQIEGYGDSLDQVTNVSQLSDVSPGDWAFEALRSLVERYGCIAGYPDGTYRGNRALTRYEFAAGLNACLQQIESLIAGLDFVTREDLETLQRLVQEFEAELATLGTRVDNLEGRVAFLEDNQFSTTTKLNGEVIFDLTGAFGEEKAGSRVLTNAGVDQPPTVSLGDDGDVDDEITFSDRVRLNFDTSFTGRDRLRTRLQAGNFFDLKAATGTAMARRGNTAGGGNDVRVTDLAYRFPVGERLTFIIGANGTSFDDYVELYNPFFSSGLSLFVQENPVVYFGLPDGQMAAVNIAFSDALSLDLAYTTNDGNDPSESNGLFDGSYAAYAQLNLGLGDNIDLGFTYVRSYQSGGLFNSDDAALAGGRVTEVDLGGAVGSNAATTPFEFIGADGLARSAAASANRFGLQASVRLGSAINVAGYLGYVDAEAESGPFEGSNADIWTGAVNVAFLDVGKEGSWLGVAFGIPPKATDIDNGTEDPDTSYFVEAEYSYPLTDNITIVPGAYVIFNPNHNDDNDTVYVGMIRTTFRF